MSPFAASAAEISYTYVEGGATRSQQDAPPGYSDPRFDGAYLRGSVELGRGFYGFGEYARTELRDDFGLDLDGEHAQLGVGYAHGLNDRVDLVSEVSYLERDGLWWGQDGARASLGLRSQLGSRVEGWAKANYTDQQVSDGDLSATLGAMYKFNPTWGLTGEAELNELEDRISLGIRASF
jgi:hypothetical protein